MYSTSWNGQYANTGTAVPAARYYNNNSQGLYTIDAPLAPQSPQKPRHSGSRTSTWVAVVVLVIVVIMVVVLGMGFGLGTFTSDDEDHTCKEYTCEHGTCIEMKDDYLCLCEPGYEGKNCHRDVNECSTDLNRCEGECRNTIGSYSCVCPHGQMLAANGKACHEIDNCKSDPCFHGVCVNGHDEFHCICESRYEGERCSTPVEKEEKRKKPHLISVYADDMGYNDIGYNNPEVITPNMDALAAEGIILGNNYAQQACTPSRSAFMTGRYPSSIGVQHGLLSTWTPHCAPTDVTFISSRLRDAGYQTHISGKWHLGACKWACTPNERGYDSFLGLLEGMGDYYTHRLQGGYDWRFNKQNDLTAINTYTTDLIRDRAIELIENYKEGDDPMFLWLTFTAPHTPLQAPQKYIDMYPDVSGDRKIYLAMITAMDDAVGEIVEALKEHGLWENTFFQFSSDNGGEKGGAASNVPLRGGKGSLFEGGTHVPGFVAGPLVGGHGTIANGMIHITDWAPTFMKMAGIEYDEDIFDGVDQTGMLLEGEESQRDEIIYHLDVEWTGGFFYGNTALRRGDLKLIWGFPGFVDGYDDHLKTFHHNDDYLALIGKSNADYTDIPPERPFQYWLSPQEVQNQQDIARAIGIDGITEREMRNGRGQTLLFNLKNDPEERNNLAENPIYARTILEMKEYLLDIVQSDKYLPPPASVGEARNAESSPTNHPPLNAWTPGWCEDLSMNTEHWRRIATGARGGK